MFHLSFLGGIGGGTLTGVFFRGGRGRVFLSGGRAFLSGSWGTTSAVPFGGCRGGRNSLSGVLGACEGVLSSLNSSLGRLDVVIPTSLSGRGGGGLFS